MSSPLDMTPGTVHRDWRPHQVNQGHDVTLFGAPVRADQELMLSGAERATARG
jgi:hypothetical protein